ncbi:hypothetical protein A6R68_08227 [Neotoma lepida]|uniref:Uncharacterized protein n=1 Tax=Neotoma lepida TaxID=56216 RepID=A0A1A6G367_NEOLE|nr:hypothetical protein A6R68_08227 [Neotoma lepida]
MKLSGHRGSNMGFSGGTRVESVATPRTNSGAGHRVGGPKRVMNFCCTCFKIQRVMLNLRVSM